MTGARETSRDFWGRRTHVPIHEGELEIVGRVVTVAGDDPRVVDAVACASGSYSSADPGGRRFRIELTSIPGSIDDPPTVPDDLFDRIHYVGHGDWLGLDLGALGHLQIDLGAGLARGMLAPALLARPDEVARCLLHTATTNLLLRDGVGMVHAAALVRRRSGSVDVVLLAGADGAGKSTAALRMVEDGWSLLSESSVYVEEVSAGLRLAGFPVGLLRLRADVRDAAAGWPVTEERVRGETKYRVDLRGRSGAVWPVAVVPDHLRIVVVERDTGANGAAGPIPAAEVTRVLAEHSMHWDTEAVWATNEALIGRLAEAAVSFRVGVGPGAGLDADTVAGLPW